MTRRKVRSPVRRSAGTLPCLIVQFAVEDVGRFQLKRVLDGGTGSHFSREDGMVPAVART